MGKGISSFANKSKLVMPFELSNLISPNEVSSTGAKLIPKSIGPFPSKEHVFSFTNGDEGQMYEMMILKKIK